MTRAQAAVTLRELLGEEDGSDYARALTVAIRALEPAKPRKPAVSPMMAAWLKFKPVDTSRYMAVPGAAAVEHKMSPEARAQFAYTGRRPIDKAILHAARA